MVYSSVEEGNPSGPPPPTPIPAVVCTVHFLGLQRDTVHRVKRVGLLESPLKENTPTCQGHAGLPRESRFPCNRRVNNSHHITKVTSIANILTQSPPCSAKKQRWQVKNHFLLWGGSQPSFECFCNNKSQSHLKQHYRHPL